MYYTLIYCCSFSASAAYLTKHPLHLLPVAASPVELAAYPALPMLTFHPSQLL